MRVASVIAMVACGSAPPAPRPAPIAPPIVTPAPPPASDCSGRACLDEAEALFARGEHDRAIIAAFSRCRQHDAEACLVTAGFFDAATIATRFGTTAKGLRDDAARELDDGCRKQDPAACFELGRLHMKLGSGRDELAKACTLGHGEACMYLAGVTTDPKRVDELVDRACTLRDANGCLKLGHWQTACELGNAAGCAHVAASAKASGDRAAATAALEAGCALDDASACVEAGTLAEPKDPAHARALFEAACRVEPGPGCVRLGALVAKGAGGPRNWGRAIELLDAACEHATAGACAEATRVKAHPPDWHCATEAACTALCDEKLARSCTKLGEHVASRSCDDAAHAFETGCTLGDLRGCRLAGNHAVGSRAATFYETACAGGDVEGCVLRDALAFRVDRKGETLERLHRACLANQGDACVWFANEIDATRSIKLFHAACDHGDGHACRLEADLIHIMASYETIDVAVADKKTAALLHRACALGDAPACAQPDKASRGCGVDEVMWERE